MEKEKQANRHSANTEQTGNHEDQLSTALLQREERCIGRRTGDIGIMSWCVNRSRNEWQPVKWEP